MSHGLSPSSTPHFKPVQQTKAHPTFHFLAGLLSGLSTSVLLQPADLLKTRVQQSRNSTLLPVLRSLLASPHPIASLWRGTLPSALRTGFGSALYFSSLHTLRQRIAQRQQRVSTEGVSLSLGDGITPSTRPSSVLPRLSNSENLLTGAVARVFAGFLMMPVTVIKVRYESDFYAYRSILGASRDILSREGLRGFFAGLGATAVRDAPYAGLYVVFYEGSKKKLNGVVGKDGGVIAASVNFASGVFAAGLATSITNPFDAVKTRLQLFPVKYGNMVRATKLMLKEDGVRSLFDGLALRMGRKALSSALAWTVYEELIGRAERFSEKTSAKSVL
ncbi:Solute carrier family 25 member 38 [Endocarpon pusillum Z07020]|uniref:Mitochondrial glycine transporter n=1 Tax=Endocarpon pusillum (strain Z07020 / HMAS-L-300199) TaxID=1263415 RepID=U1G0F3_ENDPU|nr:Solute carrier family 25 member 38 [Endocarpon pusillum Z07020]ERF70672.1 Solute carrier family 25 member 38 [Endocarpon pusillum Z07020]